MSAGELSINDENELCGISSKSGGYSKLCPSEAAKSLVWAIAIIYLNGCNIAESFEIDPFGTGVKAITFKRGVIANFIENSLKANTTLSDALKSVNQQQGMKIIENQWGFGMFCSRAKRTREDGGSSSQNSMHNPTGPNSTGAKRSLVYQL